MDFICASFDNYMYYLLKLNFILKKKKFYTTKNQRENACFFIL